MRLPIRSVVPRTGGGKGEKKEPPRGTNCKNCRNKCENQFPQKAKSVTGDLQEQPTKVGPETAMECVRRALWGMLYVDDACVVSRSPQGLERMMATLVDVFGAFGLTVSEKKQRL